MTQPDQTARNALQKKLGSKFYIPLAVANIFLAVGFMHTGIFWPVLSAAYLVLGFVSIRFGSIGHAGKYGEIALYGTLSGFLLYAVCATGNYINIEFDLPFRVSIAIALAQMKPAAGWQYIGLFIVIIGEELFWRGYLQNLLVTRFSKIGGVFLGALVYALAHIYTGNALLVLAAFFCGASWGLLYEWKKNIWIVILNHIVFDLMLLVIMPFV